LIQINFDSRRLAILFCTGTVARAFGLEDDVQTRLH
jgi:hypothetical protein